MFEKNDYKSVIELCINKESISFGQIEHCLNCSRVMAQMIVEDLCKMNLVVNGDDIRLKGVHSEQPADVLFSILERKIAGLVKRE